MIRCNNNNNKYSKRTTTQHTYGQAIQSQSTPPSSPPFSHSTPYGNVPPQIRAFYPPSPHLYDLHHRKIPYLMGEQYHWVARWAIDIARRVISIVLRDRSIAILAIAAYRNLIIIVPGLERVLERGITGRSFCSCVVLPC